MDHKLMHKVANVLCKEEHLLKSIPKFTDAIGIPDQSLRMQLNRYHMGLITPYEIIYKILSEWITRTGAMATIAELRKILHQLNFKRCSDMLGEIEDENPGHMARHPLKNDAIKPISSLRTPAFQQIVKTLSMDAILLRQTKKFKENLGIPPDKTHSTEKRFHLGHCTPYDLIGFFISEWITICGDSATVAQLREILLKMDFRHLSDELCKLEDLHPGPIRLMDAITWMENEKVLITQAAAISRPDDISFGVKNVALNFIGREEELQRLQEYYHSPKSHFVLVSGLGGIGKTEIAKKFTLLTSDSLGSSQVAKSWLSGETPQTLLNSVGKFCHHLQLSATNAAGKPLPIEKMLRKIMKKLKSSEQFSRWIIIIDNVDEEHEEFETCFRTLHDFASDVFVLLTSRRRDIYPGELELVEVMPLKFQDSVEYVKKSLRITDQTSEDEIKSLCIELDNFPLALEQSVAFIRQQQSVLLKGRAYGVQNYLDEIAKNQVLGLDKERKLSAYSTSLLRVWQITLRNIKENYVTDGEMALDILNAMAYINPDDIQMNSLRKLYNTFYNETVNGETQIEACLTLLLKYSMISVFDGNISVHRLVQRVLRHQLESIPSVKTPLLSKNIELLQQFWTSFKDKDWNKLEMRNIVLSVWLHSSDLPELVEGRNACAQAIFDNLHSLGMVNESYEFAQEFSTTDSYDSKINLQMELRLAISLKAKGQYETSLEILTTLYEKLKQIFGEESEEVLQAGNYITAVLYDMSRYEESFEWGQQILRTNVLLHGEQSEVTMTAKNNIALTLKALRKAEEAMATFQEIFQWAEAHLGTNHQQTLSARLNIGCCLYDTGKFAEARCTFTDLLSTYEDFLGVDHPDTLHTKAYLADPLFAMGDTSQALELMEEVLVAREKVLGPEHPQTVSAREKCMTFKTELDSLNDQQKLNTFRGQVENSDICNKDRIDEPSEIQIPNDYWKIIERINLSNPELASVVKELWHEMDNPKAVVERLQDHFLTQMPDSSNTINLNNLVSFLANDTSLFPKIPMLAEALKLYIPDELWKMWCNQVVSNDLTIPGVMRNVLLFWKRQKGELNIHQPTFTELMLKLKQIGCENTAGQLYQQNKLSGDNVVIDWTSDYSQTPVIFQLEETVSNFIGRKAELDKLKQLYQNEATPGVVVSGVMGVGKTQFVGKFLKDLNEDSDKPLMLIWLDGQSFKTFSESLRQLCLHLFFPVIDPQTNRRLCHKSILELIMKEAFQLKSLQKKHPCVIVIDNLDDELDDIFQAIRNDIYLPVCFPIIISRQGNLFVEKSFAQLPLSGLEVEDSKDFLISELGLTKHNENELTDLCAKLKNFPLWLQQVVVYIKIKRKISWKGQRYGITDYLIEYGEDNTTGLTERLPFHEYGKTVLDFSY